MTDKIDLMNAEFDAARKLAEQYRRITLTAVVEDDFPLVKADYSRAADNFVAAYLRNTPLFGACHGLTLQRLARVNLSRANRWHPEGLSSWSLSEWGIALGGEVGELQNVVKKLNRHRNGLQQKLVVVENLKRDLADEIGDVLTYLDLFAQAAGLELETCFKNKFNKISDREGFPEKF